ncbi:MAG: GGDEF domain-containing protein [Deferribacteres bacterium]|nr:GGDEF domain-containing protein [Deferribacteres bacterium]
MNDFIGFSFRKRLYKILLALAIPSELITGIYDFYKGKHLLLWAKILFALVLLYAYEIAEKDYKRSLFIAVSALTLTYLVVIPAQIYDPFLSSWIVVYVIAITFLLGNRWGFVAMCFSFFLVVLTMFLNTPSFFSADNLFYTFHMVSATLVAYLITSSYNRVVFQAHKKIKERAERDYLTGCYNRRKLFEVLEDEVEKARRYGFPLSAVMVDIDNFKQINDLYGHHEGDRILKRVVDLIKESTRKTDIIGRYGGDEFILIAPGTDCEGASRLAEKIREKVERWGNGVGISLSVGVAEYRGEDLDEFVERLDRALLEAKSKGKNKVVRVC